MDITVSSLAADTDPENRTQYFTFRPDAQGVLAEDGFYRNLHPMLAKRLELWRLSNFELHRLPSSEDVYLFHGIARDNPKDHRLFALAEVRDLTAVPHGRGEATTYPKLEWMGLRAIIAMRRARATFPERERPQANRITLFVRPPWDVPREQWSDLAELLIPLAGGAGLELVVMRTLIPAARRHAAPHRAQRGRHHQPLHHRQRGAGARRPRPAADEVPAEGAHRAAVRSALPVGDPADVRPASRARSASSCPRSSSSTTSTPAGEALVPGRCANRASTPRTSWSGC